jgi:hypothetical protein
MQDLLRLALLAVQAMTSDPPPPVTRPFWGLAAAACVSLCLLVASGLLLTACWLFLLPHLGAAGTPALLGVIALANAGAILLWLRARTTPKAPPPAAPVDIAPILAEAQRLFDAHRPTAFATALLAGLALGARRG